MLTRARVWVCLVVALGAAGCNAPLDKTVNVTFDHGDKIQVTYDLDGQPKAQALKVEVTAADSELNVFIVLADKQAEFDKATGEARAKVAAAAELYTKKATLTVTMPAKVDARVYVQLAGTKKTEATIRMTNRK